MYLAELSNLDVQLIIITETLTNKRGMKNID